MARAHLQGRCCLALACCIALLLVAVAASSSLQQGLPWLTAFLPSSSSSTRPPPFLNGDEVLNITMLRRSHTQHNLQADVLPLHWVIKSCFRPHLGRILSSTLLSGMFSGLRPATVSVAFCKPYHADQLPSFVYNSRHSPDINFFFADERTSKYNDTGATAAALSVPHLLGRPDLHLFITEDDILFAPNAMARLRAAADRAQQLSGTDPYFINYYRGNVSWVTVESPDDLATLQDDLPDDAVPAGATSPEVVQQLPDEHREIDRGALWGSQASLYSPGMVRLMLDYYTQVFRVREAGNRSSPLFGWSEFYADVVTLNALIKHYKCNEPGVPCHAFLARTSLVQHTGTYSMFCNEGRVNKKFHTANRFPVRVKFPALDKDQMW